MTNSRRTFTSEQKLQAIERALQLGIDATSAETNIPPGTIRRWINLRLAPPKTNGASDANLRFLSKTHRALMDTRRKYEWRIFAAMLGFYVVPAGTVLAGSRSIRLLTTSESIGAFVVAAALAMASILYLKSLHGANEKNKNFARRAEDLLYANAISTYSTQADERDDSPTADEGRPTDGIQEASNTPWNYSLFWQSSLIALTAVACAVVVCFVRLHSA